MSILSICEIFRKDSFLFTQTEKKQFYDYEHVE